MERWYPKKKSWKEIVGTDWSDMERRGEGAQIMAQGILKAGSVTKNEKK